MTRRFVTFAVCFITLALASGVFAQGKQAKPGPLSGTWNCTSHGSSQGDMEFTLTMEQDKDTVTGNVSSPIGSAEFSNATYKDKTLEIHIDAGDSEYVLTGKLASGKLSGEWTHGDEKGTWDGKKEAPASK